MVIAGVEYVTTGQGAAELAAAGVTEAMIRQWAARGLVEAVFRSPSGRPVYRLEDLWSAERDTRKSGRRRSCVPAGR